MGQLFRRFGYSHCTLPATPSLDAFWILSSFGPLRPWFDRVKLLLRPQRFLQRLCSMCCWVEAEGGFVKWIRRDLGGGFKDFLFSPITWGRFPIWRAYFSNGWFNHQPETDDFLWIFPNVQGLTLILATSNGWWTPAGVGKTWYNCEVCSVLRYQYSVVTREFLRQFYFYTIMIFSYLTVCIPRLESISWNWLVECVSGNPTT